MKKPFEKFKDQVLSAAEFKAVQGGGCAKWLVVGVRRHKGHGYVDLYCPSSGESKCDHQIY